MQLTLLGKFPRFCILLSLDTVQKIWKEKHTCHDKNPDDTINPHNLYQFFISGGGFLRSGNAGPQRIEDVVDWDMVGKRYLSIKGEDDEEEDVKKEEVVDGESNGNAVINKDWIGGGCKEPTQVHWVVVMENITIQELMNSTLCPVAFLVYWPQSCDCEVPQ